MSGAEKNGISKRFAGDLGFKAFAELVSSLCGLYVFALLSRMCGKGGDYAVINQIVAMGSLIAPLLLCRMNTAFCVFLPGDKDQSRVRSRFAWVFLLTLAVGALFYVVVTVPQVRLAFLLWGNADYAPLLPMMALYYVILALTMLCQSFLQATGHQKKSDVFVLVSVVLSAVGFTVLVATPSVTASSGVTVLSYAMGVYLLANGVVLIGQVATLLWDWRGVKIAFSGDRIRPMYRYAFPLLPVTVMSWFNSYIGRFLLNHMVGDELRSASVYGFYDSLTSRAFFINAVLVYTVFPYIAKAWNQHNRRQVIEYLHKSFHIGLFAAVPITAGLVLVCPTLVSWVSDGNYPTNRGVLLALCLAQLFQMLYMNFSYLIDLSRKTQWFNGIFLMSALTNVLFCLLLIPHIGMMGSAIGLAVAFGLQLFVAAFISHHMAGISVLPDLLQALKAVLSAAVMYLVCDLLYYRGVMTVSGLWGLLVVVATGVAVYLLCQWLLTRLTKTRFF